MIDQRRFNKRFLLCCVFVVWWPCIVNKLAHSEICLCCNYPDSKVHGANTGPNWVLSAPDGPHVGPMKLLSGYSCVSFAAHCLMVPLRLQPIWTTSLNGHIFNGHPPLDCNRQAAVTHWVRNKMTQGRIQDLKLGVAQTDWKILKTEGGGGGGWGWGVGVGGGGWGWGVGGGGGGWGVGVYCINKFRIRLHFYSIIYISWIRYIYIFQIRFLVQYSIF